MADKYAIVSPLDPRILGENVAQYDGVSICRVVDFAQHIYMSARLGEMA